MPTRDPFRHVSSASVKDGPLWQGGINYAQLREVVDFLGIKWPVRIRRTSGYHKTGGYTCRLVNGKPEHFLTVSGYQRTLAQANRSIIHELTHAMQVEAEGNYRDFSHKYASATHQAAGATKFKRYLNNPYEVEARENADYLGTEYSITKRGK